MTKRAFDKILKTESKKLSALEKRPRSLTSEEILYEGTITVDRYHCDMSKNRQRNARVALRNAIRANPNYHTNALQADCVIEEIWNALVGNK